MERRTNSDRLEELNGPEDKTPDRFLDAQLLAARAIGESLGVYDASQDSPTSPIHIDEHWQTDFEAGVRK